MKKKSLEARMEYLKSLEHGWAGDGSGKPISCEVLKRVEAHIKRSQAFEPERPFIYPNEDSGVALEWCREHGTGMVFYNPDGSFSLEYLKGE